MNPELTGNSREQIIGFKAPSWEKTVDLVKSAVIIIPGVRYVSWDVVVDRDGNIQPNKGS